MGLCSNSKYVAGEVDIRKKTLYGFLARWTTVDGLPRACKFICKAFLNCNNIHYIIPLWMKFANRSFFYINIKFYFGALYNNFCDKFRLIIIIIFSFYIPFNFRYCAFCNELEMNLMCVCLLLLVLWWIANEIYRFFCQNRETSDLNPSLLSPNRGPPHWGCPYNSIGGGVVGTSQS